MAAPATEGEPYDRLRAVIVEVEELQRVMSERTEVWLASALVHLRAGLASWLGEGDG